VIPPIPSQDPVTRALHDLADDIRLRPAAALSAEHDESDCWRVDPVAGSGLSVEWDDDGERWIAVEVGDHRFALLRDAEAVEYLRDIVMAVIEGTITEVRALGRARIRIPRSDGTITCDTGHGFPLGLIPLPGWVRRATPVQHAAYEQLPQGG
jgi:hypothetical protein